MGNKLKTRKLPETVSGFFFPWQRKETLSARGLANKKNKKTKKKNDPPLSFK